LLLATGGHNQISHLRRQEAPQPAHALNFAHLVGDASFELLVELLDLFSSLAQFFQKSRVLDSDYGLRSKVCHQLNLLISERPNFLAGQVKCTDQFVVFQHGHRHCRPNPAEFDRGYHPFIVSFNVMLLLRKVCDVDHLFVCNHLAHGVLTTKRLRLQAPARLDEFVYR
jgi:hypothetical protein